MKLILFTSLALVVGMIIGCGSNPSNPARSTAPETAREIAATPARGVTLPGSSKITPTQVQIRLPKILSQGSDEIRQLEYRISQLENTVRDQKRTVSDLKRTVGNSRFDPRSLQSDVRALKSDVQDLKRKLR